MKLLQPNRLSATLAATLLTAGLTAGTASGAIVNGFDTVNDELSSPTVIDDFTDSSLAKWDTSGSASAGGGTLEITGGASAKLTSSERIALPDVGEVLIIEADGRGRSQFAGNTVSITNDDGTLNAFVRTSNSSDYDAEATSVSGSIRTTTSHYGFSSPDTFRFVLDNTAGNREVSVHVKKNGASTYELLEYTNGDDVTATNAWSDPNADVAVLFNLTQGGTTLSRHNFARFQTIVPEPASAALLGLGGLLIAGRRRQRA